MKLLERSVAVVAVVVLAAACGSGYERGSAHDDLTGEVFGFTDEQADCILDDVEDEGLEEAILEEDPTNVSAEDQEVLLDILDRCVPPEPAPVEGPVVGPSGYERGSAHDDLTGAELGLTDGQADCVLDAVERQGLEAIFVETDIDAVSEQEVEVVGGIFDECVADETPGGDSTADRVEPE